jgi:alkylation response protein AidB-like acyl-CoA dehydrogenase
MAQFRAPSIGFDLGETAEMIRESVAGFAEREIAPIADGIDRTNRFPREQGERLASRTEYRAAVAPRRRIRLRAAGSHRARCPWPSRPLPA